MIHARLGCGEPGSLNRFPPRNLLINAVVYVSGRTFSVSGGEKMEVESDGIQDGETGTGGEGKR